MSKVFLCYRRSDTAYKPEFLQKNLEEYLGKNLVFYDHHIEDGTNWKVKLNEKIRSSKAMMVLMGTHWLKDGEGRERLFEENDFVRYEIECALQKINEDPSYKIYPLLFDGASMPSSDQLPESIRALCDYQATVINPNEINSSISKLGKKLCLEFYGKAYCFWRQFRLHVFLIFIFLVLAVAGIYFLIDQPKCDNLEGNSRIAIMVNPVTEKGVLSREEQIELKNKITDFLHPFSCKVGFIRGNTQKVSPGLKDLSMNCGAQILIQRFNHYSFDILDSEIEYFFVSNYGEHQEKLGRYPSDFTKMFCLFKSYLFTQWGNSYQPENFLEHCVSIYEYPSDQCMISQATLQNIALVYEQRQDYKSALNILMEIDRGGFNPEIIFSRQAKLAEFTGNIDAGIVAHSGLINLTSGNKKDSLLRVRSKQFEQTGELDRAIKDLQMIRESQRDNRSIETEINRLELKKQNPATFSDRPAVTGGYVDDPSTSDLINRLRYLEQNNNTSEVDRLIRNNSEDFETNPVLRSEYERIQLNRGQITIENIPEESRRLNPNLDREIRVRELQSIRPIDNNY